MKKRSTLLLGVGLVTASALPAAAADPAPTVRLDAPSDSMELPDLDVVARRLDAARQSIQPSLGATRYDFDPEALAAIPRGENAPLNQVLLQAPGVAEGVAYTFNKDTSHPTLVTATLLVQSGLRKDGTVPNGDALGTSAVVDASIVQKGDLGFGAGTELRLDALNLLDQTYQIRDGTGIGVGAPQYGSRRTILAGLTQRF